MKSEQKDFFNELNQNQEKVSEGWIDYWFQYSGFETWQFWFNLGMFLIPLIILYFLIDKRKAFHIGFFGFNIHVWFTYFDVFGAKFDMWSYPYQLLPIMTVSFGLDVSFIPVIFMLLYQWTLNERRNFYLYATLLSAILSFFFKPIMVYMNLFDLRDTTTYFHLFSFYIIIFITSKLITNLFLHFEQREKTLL